ncbi:MAG: allantoinase AllB [Candidatus Angelobacter sp.]
MSDEWTIRSRRVILPDGIAPASIRMRDGVIQGIGPFDAPADQDVGELVIMPGLVDTHVHINEPGRTEWEGFFSATRAAAAGGITTIIDMPLNSIPATTSAEAFHQKADAARDQCWVDVGFWGGVVPDNAAELRPLLHAGCFGFKCFLTPSGVDEFQYLERPELRRGMYELSRLGARLLVHAELPEFICSSFVNARVYSDYLNSRPKIAEDAAIDLLLRLSRETGCAVHIVHLSSADSIESLRAAREQSLPVTVETCPHYLTLRAEEIPEGATEFKCAPPIREEANCDTLWEALRNGVIDMIVSDHSPSPPEMKCKTTGDFFAAWGGIASLQLALPVIWTEASVRGFAVEDIARWMAAGPAKIAGLSGKKGSIAPGCDADLVVWDPAEEFTVDPTVLHHRHKLTPYSGRRLRGVVKKTYLRGQPVLSGTTPSGIVLKRAWGRAESRFV